jgi:serine/threonine protein kinase
VTEGIRSAAFDAAAGGQIAGYQLAAEIGRGGMAIVYRALDTRLGRTVALKILAPQLAEDESFRRRFIHESRAAAAVDHPHIVPVFEAGESDGSLFIAMRYVGTGDVRTLLERDGALPVPRAVTIASQVASALDAAHARGLIHRDIKPANMLLASSADGRADHVYLSDFGLSKQSLAPTGLTSTGQFMGTLDYVAPEQIEGKAVDGRSDQYALACTTFEMLTGAPPFRREENLALMWAQLSEPPPPPSQRRPELPPAVDQVICKALAKAPDDRYRSCLEFAVAMRAACAPQPGPPDPGAQQARRSMTELAHRSDPRAAGPGPLSAPADPPTQGVSSVPPVASPQWAWPGAPAPSGQQTAAEPWEISGRPAAGDQQILREQWGRSGSQGAADQQPLPDEWFRSASVAPGGQGAPSAPSDPWGQPGAQVPPDPWGRPVSQAPSGPPGPYGTAAVTVPPPTGQRPPPRRRRGAAAAMGVTFIAVVCLALVGFRLLHHRAHSTVPPKGGVGVTISTPPPQVGVTTPAQTVQAYFRAINRHRYARAYRIGGQQTGESYSSFVTGLNGTAHDTVQILSTNGDVVTARLTATQTDGSVKTFEGTYTISNGTIEQSSVQPVS